MNRPKLYYNNENKSNVINNIGFFFFLLTEYFLVVQGREFIVLVLNYLPYTFEFVNFSPISIYFEKIW